MSFQQPSPICHSERSEESAVLRTFPGKLAHTNRAQLQQGGNLFNLRSGVPYPDGAMMCRAMRIPGFYKFARTQRKPIPAVGIADFQNGSRNAFPFGNL